MQATLQAVLDEEIPITQAMALRVVRCSADEVVIRAPLAANTNHKSTAFGGSLYTSTVLAGWGLLWCILRTEGLDGHIVIHESSVRYGMPVHGDWEARSTAPAAHVKRRFISAYQRYGRARLSLRAEVCCANAVAVEFSGRYVVHR